MIFKLSNVIVVPTLMLVVGSNVMVKDPMTGSIGAPAKPLAVKLMVSVIAIAFARACTQSEYAGR